MDKHDHEAAPRGRPVQSEGASSSRDGVHAETPGSLRDGPDYTMMFYWVRERETIRIAKEAWWTTELTQRCFDNHVPRSQPSLTADPILQEWRFCNVRREDDPVTIWIRKNIRERFAGHPLLWLMLCAARQINWPPTLRELIVNDAFPGLHEGWIERMEMQMDARKGRGEKVYTGAYTITAPRTKGMSKIEFTCHTVLGQLERDRGRIESALFPRIGSASVQRVCERLMQYEAWGGDGFMTYQAVGDMLFTPLLANAPDRDIFMIAGPGTRRGLNRLYRRPLEARTPQEQMRSELRKLFKAVPEKTGVSIAINDAGNICCEFDKYMRVKNGEGLPRKKYEPAAEPWEDLPPLAEGEPSASNELALDAERDPSTSASMARAAEPSP